MSNRKPYPMDVSDDEWAFVAPYLTLMTEDAPQREVFNGAFWIVRTGARWMVRTSAQWRMMPNDLPPWYTVYQQTQRWLRANFFESILHDLRELLRIAQGRKPQSTAAIFDGRTLQSTPESGGWAGWGGAKKKNGSQVHSKRMNHMAVDTWAICWPFWRCLPTF